jgi:hypothetical protein
VQAKRLLCAVALALLVSSLSQATPALGQAKAVSYASAISYARVFFTGAVNIRLVNPPASVSCQQQGAELTVRISGTTGADRVDLSLELYGFGGLDDFGLSQSPGGTAGAYLAKMATSPPLYGRLTSGSVRLGSSNPLHGRLFARYAGPSNGGTVFGDWSCVLPPPIDYSASQIVAKLNAQRAANDIPAGVTLDSPWSAACKDLDLYEHLHGDNFVNSEIPGSPGSSVSGTAMAQSEPVLAIDGGSSVSGWAANPFESGPNHLFGLLNPRLSVMGANDSVFSQGSGLVEEMCATTSLGYLRPSPGADSVYTYPGDGASIYPLEIANEMPPPPGTTVGIPSGATTGPYLLVFAEGPFPSASVMIESATLVGPEGAVAVKVVNSDATGGGFVIPVSPLLDHASYQAVVNISVAGAMIRHSWGFTTDASDTEAGGATGPGITTVQAVS